MPTQLHQELKTSVGGPPWYSPVNPGGFDGEWFDSGM